MNLEQTFFVLVVLTLGIAPFVVVRRLSAQPKRPRRRGKSTFTEGGSGGDSSDADACGGFDGGDGGCD